ncbi:MAG: hypothetical protein U0794_07835 [Isosphaeraceae bacterium]
MMARLGASGDRVIVMAFAELTPEELDGHHSRVVGVSSTAAIATERIEYPRCRSPSIELLSPRAAGSPDPRAGDRA